MLYRTCSRRDRLNRDQQIFFRQRQQNIPKSDFSIVETIKEAGYLVRRDSFIN